MVRSVKQFIGRPYSVAGLGAKIAITWESPGFGFDYQVGNNTLTTESNTFYHDCLVIVKHLRRIDQNRVKCFNTLLRLHQNSYAKHQFWSFLVLMPHNVFNISWKGVISGQNCAISVTRTGTSQVISQIKKYISSRLRLFQKDEIRSFGAQSSSCHSGIFQLIILLYIMFAGIQSFNKDTLKFRKLQTSKKINGRYLIILEVVSP